MRSKSPPRNPVWPVALALLVCSGLHAAEGTKPSPAPAASIPTLRPTYDSFRLVHTRNVFDPDRRPVRPVSNAPSLPATRSDYVALTGTLLSAEKSYAFFSGSRPEFNRVLTVREKIANASITGITSANIEVERDGKHLTIAVGQTVPFDNQTAPGTPPAEAPPCRRRFHRGCPGRNGSGGQHGHDRRPGGLCPPVRDGRHSHHPERPCPQSRRSPPPHDGKTSTGTQMNARHLLPLLLLTGCLGTLLPTAARAQRDRDPLADPLPVADGATYAEVDVAQLDLAMPPPPLAGPPPVTAPGGDTGAGHSSLPSTPRDAAPTPTPTPGTIRLNFQNAQLSDVLNSLSAAAGFIVVQQAAVTGTINLNSQQPVTPDEAVDALNSALIDKGYVAIRNGRVLKIIARDGAQKSDLPVVQGSAPAGIPRKDNVVTQIMPVRYIEVAKLVDTLRPLLSDSATIASNDNANAVVLTDTQANIHRIAEIIHALDSSVSSISVIRVYTLRYADAKELADVVTQLFESEDAKSSRQQPNQGFPFFGGNRGGGRGGQQQAAASAAPTSEARQAASRVIAVADETTNSVVVSAPDEFMSAIDDLVAKLDTNTTEVTETQIFKLQHADATEVAASLTALYSDQTTANGAAGGNNNNNRGGNNRGFPGQGNNGAAASTVSERALQQARVIAVADPRTNSVLVNASRASISQIALLVGRLDASDSKKQHIYVHSLAHADPENVAAILSGMFSVSSTNSTYVQPSTTRLDTRSQTGLTTDAQSTLGGSSSSSSSNRSGSGLR